MMVEEKELKEGQVKKQQRKICTLLEDHCVTTSFSGRRSSFRAAQALNETKSPAMAGDLFSALDF